MLATTTIQSNIYWQWATVLRLTRHVGPVSFSLKHLFSLKSVVASSNPALEVSKGQSKVNAESALRLLFYVNTATEARIFCLLLLWSEKKRKTTCISTANFSGTKVDNILRFASRLQTFFPNFIFHSNGQEASQCGEKQRWIAPCFFGRKLHKCWDGMWMGWGDNETDGRFFMSNQKTANGSQAKAESRAGARRQNKTWASFKSRKRLNN